MQDDTSSPSRPPALEIGVVSKPHGVRGAFKVWLHNPASEALQTPEALYLELADGAIVEALAFQTVAGGQPVFTVDAATSREQAEAIRGAKLMLRREAIVLDPGQYLYTDLIGCEALEGERSYGRVTQVFEAGADDVLVIVDGDHERMIPLREPWVAQVDIERKRIALMGADQWEPQKK